MKNPNRHLPKVNAFLKIAAGQTIDYIGEEKTLIVSEEDMGIQAFLFDSFIINLKSSYDEAKDLVHIIMTANFTLEGATDTVVKEYFISEDIPF